MKKKKCVVIYGKARSGKSPLWDYVMGYKWDKKLHPRGINRHLPDGIYSNHNINGSVFNILFIGQSLEETKRVQKKEEILAAFEYDILFISVQKKCNSETIEYLKNNYDVKLFEIENSTGNRVPQISPICIFETINTNNINKLAPQYAEKIRECIVNW